MATSDPYKILGVTRDASDEDIRKAYRKLAREYHPDVNPGDQAAEKRFKGISSAYELLSDSDKRKAYDEFGEASQRTGFDPNEARAHRQWQERRRRGGRPFENERINLDDIFGAGGFGGFGGAARPARGADIHATARLDLRQVATGTEVSIQVPGSSSPTRVRIPAGADQGSTIRLKGRGQRGDDGAPAGDLIIETHVEAHPIFERRGLNLYMRLPVTLLEAVKGATVEVPTFSGPVNLNIPPHTQNRSKLRLRGKGITKKVGGHDKSGDLFVEVDLRLPDKEDKALLKALSKSDALYSKPVREEVKL